MKNRLSLTSRCAKIFPFLAIFVLFSPSPALAAANSHDIALDLTITGKSGWRSCDAFARDLYQRITRSGGEATYIVYDWQDDNNACGRHAFIVYRDGQGRYWGMDNRQQFPKWLEGKTPQEWVKGFAQGVDSQLTYSYTNIWLKGRYVNSDHEALPPEAKSEGMPQYVAATGQANLPTIP